MKKKFIQKLQNRINLGLNSLTLLYPCNSNHPVSYKCCAVFGIARNKFNRDILSIERINILSGRCISFVFSLNSLRR